jgi:prolyl oligopeptidase
VEGYRAIVQRADQQLASVFGTLPGLAYRVLAIPADEARGKATAYYEPGSTAAGRPGNCFVNTYDLKARPKWEMEALALHECVPGHHLQVSIAQTLKGVPKWRNYHDYTPFVEGWGVYAETLGDEMGFYRDPYFKFGQLSYEMWRAIRLVVDTGIHAEGWTREKAILYFRENTAQDDRAIDAEINRYISIPGQAVAYTIGELKIKELRAAAQKELGPAFDVRAFHDEVLRHGAMPLDLLEQNVKAWVATRKVRPAAR